MHLYSGSTSGTFREFPHPFLVLFIAVLRDYFCTMDLYDAIKEMRRLSSEGKSFSFTFMSYNSSKGTSEGIVSVQHGRLRKRERAEFHADAEMVEAYTDLDTMADRRFWQPLLMTFNGEKVILQ